MENVSVALNRPSSVFINSFDIDSDRIDAGFYSNKYIKNYMMLKKSSLKLEPLINLIERINAPIGWQGIPSESYLPHGEGTPLIRVQNVSNLILDEGALIGVENQIYNEQPAIQAQANDIIITRVGTIGRVCRIPKNIKKIAMGQNLTRIKMKESIVDSCFILAYMSSEFCQNEMERYAYGGVQASLTNKNIKQLLIPVPSYEVQKYIGDKIRKAEELREDAKRLKNAAEDIITNYLGEITLSIDKKYSINFLPVNDIEERIDSEYYNGKYFCLYNELNAKGYKLKTLKDVCDGKIYNGKTCKVISDTRKYMNIGVGELGDWYVNKNTDKYVDESINEKYILKKNSIIWGNSAHLAKYIGEKVNIILEENLYIPTTEITYIIPNKEKINPYYLFLYMKSKWGYYQIQRSIKGMTAHSYPVDISKIKVPLINFSLEELDILKQGVELGNKKISQANKLIEEAKKDVEDLIEGNFKMLERNK